MEKDKSVFLYFAGHEKYFYMLKKNLEKIFCKNCCVLLAGAVQMPFANGICREGGGYTDLII